MSFEKWSKSLLYSYESLDMNYNNVSLDRIYNEDDEENNFGKQYDYPNNYRRFIKSTNIPNYLTNRLCQCSNC